jgi:DNA-binding MarR family transcriptional regulator
LTSSTSWLTESTFLYIGGMIDDDVKEFRLFTRFFTAYIGILNRHYMKSEYSLPQTRVMHAIYTRNGITPTEITAMLNMDKSYLSRILIDFEKKKLIRKEVAEGDRRVVELFLTKFGQNKFSAIDNAVDREVKRLLMQLSASERKNVMKCMTQIRKTLAIHKLEGNPS